MEKQLLKEAREYIGLTRIIGPLIVLEKTHAVGYNEYVEIEDNEGNKRTGLVLDTSDEFVVVQVFEGTTGLDIEKTKVKFKGVPMLLPVTPDMIGRVFNGVGKPIDGGPYPVSRDNRNVNGLPINPSAREYPQKFIQTGISAIDGMNTLVRGQKLPIFSGSGLPHNRIAAQITRQAKIVGEKAEFAIVFAAMGVSHDTAEFFIKNFEETGAIQRTTMFLSLADDPPIERLITPRCALTFAEYLAFNLEMHVLVILTDMTNYCEALREISTIRGEIPGRKGYPGYLYSDLASIYERAGMIKECKGSITQVPILTMPNDDISHPIPDLTGYITEGQIVLERELHNKGIYPPIAGLPSLSRLMKDGIGEGLTREDHPHLASQLFAAYARVKEIRALASIIGEEELTPLDHKYLEFGEAFEKKFLSQDEYEDRSIIETLDLGWQLLSILPKEELHRVTDEELMKYYPG
ncbi:MAG: V-type ATP synthase subunit B [Thermoplasmata archaeon]|nr:MAG: V-type ATP synthase subunit B [Thermoplasmata archaeon]